MSARELARTGWAGAAPEWVMTLAEACDAASMRKVAADLDVSPALVSLAIRNKHHAGLEYIRARVEARLGGVECPVLGAISTQQCRANRNRQFSSINPLAVRLYRACHGGCPHNQTP